MNAIVAKFNLPITQKQAGRVRRQWQRHGKTGCTMIAFQPVTEWGPFQVGKPFLAVAILSPELSKAITALIEAHANEWRGDADPGL